MFAFIYISPERSTASSRVGVQCLVQGNFGINGHVQLLQWSKVWLSGQWKKCLPQLNFNKMIKACCHISVNNMHLQNLNLSHTGSRLYLKIQYIRAPHIWMDTTSQNNSPVILWWDTLENDSEFFFRNLFLGKVLLWLLTFNIWDARLLLSEVKT